MAANSMYDFSVNDSSPRRSPLEHRWWYVEEAWPGLHWHTISPRSALKMWSSWSKEGNYMISVALSCMTILWSP